MDKPKEIAAAWWRAGEAASKKIEAWWEPVRDIWDVLLVCRFSAIMVVAGGLMLSFGQGQDVLIAIAEDVSFSTLLFVLAMLWWALNGWYWARVMLDFQFPRKLESNARTKWLREHTPRILGAFAFLFIAIDCVIAAFDSAGATLWRLLFLAGAAFVLGVAFYAAVRYRRRLFRIIRREFLRVPEPPPGGYANLRALPWITRLNFAFSSAVGLIMFTVATFDPVRLGGFLDPGDLFFLWAGTWIPIGCFFVYWGNHYRVPILTLLFGLAVASSFFNDNHAVRRVDTADAGKTDPDRRPMLGDAVAKWSGTVLKQRSGRVPFIIVATAGGGSRAAYWTATVLGAIQDRCPAFGDHLFAISGVSGGSLGAAAFRAALADAAVVRKPCDLSAAGAAKGPLQRRTQAAVGGDSLATALAGFFYPDMVQRFLPVPFLPDRAAALEKGWEAAWRETDPGKVSPRFAEPFLALWSKGAAWPALLLNGTWVETGRRLIASNVKLFDPAGGTSNFAFDARHDVLQMIGRDVRLSTAVDMSTRFPIVEPAGTLAPDDTGESFGRVVDGGYFENFGAITAHQVMAGALKILDYRRIEPVIIQISSDPALPDPVTAVGKVEPVRFAYELRSPVRAFLKTREARGVLAMENLRRWVTDPVRRRGRFLHFRLCRATDDTQTDPPLGWYLSQTTLASIEARLHPEGKFAGCSDNVNAWKALAAIAPRLDAGRQSAREPPSAP